MSQEERTQKYGEFHYKPHHNSDLESFIEQQARDLLKNKVCKENNVTLIRVPYTENEYLEKYIKEKLQMSKLPNNCLGYNLIIFKDI